MSKMRENSVELGIVIDCEFIGLRYHWLAYRIIFLDLMTAIINAWACLIHWLQIRFYLISVCIMLSF